MTALRGRGFSLRALTFPPQAVFVKGFLDARNRFDFCPRNLDTGAHGQAAEGAMLQRTFVHFPGIGLRRERRLWQAGVRTWSECLAAPASGRALGASWGSVRAQAAESSQAYARGDWAYFERRLPPEHKWRVYGDLAGDALFLDIETDGGSDGGAITLIGTFDGRAMKTFVRGRNLDEAAAEIERHALLVTFNGACFDLPMIRSLFPGAAGRHLHVDLRYPLRRLGYWGGLKAIERQLGLARSEATRGLTGWDAVRLWQAFCGGSREALALLEAYNAEDVLNLKPLMEFAFQSCSSTLTEPTR